MLSPCRRQDLDAHFVLPLQESALPLWQSTKILSYKAQAPLLGSRGLGDLTGCRLLYMIDTLSAKPASRKLFFFASSTTWIWTGASLQSWTSSFQSHACSQESKTSV